MKSGFSETWLTRIKDRVAARAHVWAYQEFLEKRLQAGKPDLYEVFWRQILGLPLIRNVQIQTQTRCNADCVFCPYVESWMVKHPGFMEDAVFEKLLNDLRPFSHWINQGKVCLYFMEEPLLDPKLIRHGERVYQAFPQTTLELATNALVLTETMAEKLIRLLSGKRHWIRVSHHGINKETFEFIMKIPYDTALRNLVRFLKMADGRLCIDLRGSGTSVDGNIVYFSEEQYREYWETIFREESINTRNVNLDIFKFHDRAGNIQRTERNACQNNHGAIREIDRDHPFHCSRLDEWIHVMVDGTISLCCNDYHMEVALPNIKNVNLVEYFYSKAYRDLVGRVTGRIETPPDFLCKRCISPGG